MGFIHCCSGFRCCKTYELKSDEKYKYKELDYLECCPVCEHTILQLTRIDYNNKISVYRLKNKKAKKFFEKYQKDIVSEIKDYDSSYLLNYGKFYLNYNEYGKKKKCFSNLSSMKLGLFENGY